MILYILFVSIFLFLILSYLFFYIYMIIFLKREKILSERIDNLFVEIFKKRTFKNKKEYKEFTKENKRRIKRVNNLIEELNSVVSKIEFLNNIPTFGKM